MTKKFKALRGDYPDDCLEFKPSPSGKTIRLEMTLAPPNDNQTQIIDLQDCEMIALIETLSKVHGRIT